MVTVAQIPQRVDHTPPPSSDQEESNATRSVQYRQLHRLWDTFDLLYPYYCALVF